MKREPDKETDNLATAVIGAAIEVHHVLGPRYLESIYEQALAVEFELRHITFERQKPIGVNGTKISSWERRAHLSAIVRRTTAEARHYGGLSSSSGLS